MSTSAHQSVHTGMNKARHTYTYHVNLGREREGWREEKRREGGRKKGRERTSSRDVYLGESGQIAENI